MKTSTKLLIALLTCIPISMAAYGYLLKQQFDKENFVANVYSYHPKYSFKALPAFQHVVIDGTLYVMEESALTRKGKPTKNLRTGIFSIQWEDAAIEFTGLPKKVGYKVMTDYEDIVKTKIQNDTLYISFFNPHGGNMKQPNITSNLLSINNQSLKSLQLKEGFYRLNHVNKDLSVKITNAGLNISNIDMKNFSILADNANSIDVDSSTVDLFQYSLQNHSKLNLENNQIKNFQRLNVDSLSRISVQGYAKDMEKFLPALSQSLK